MIKQFSLVRYIKVKGPQYFIIKTGNTMSTIQCELMIGNLGKQKVLSA